MFKSIFSLCLSFFKGIYFLDQELRSKNISETKVKLSSINLTLDHLYCI